ncbi:hypothetical protein ACR9WD_07060 [Glutamicibacter sp. PAEs-4]|uniref:hypothetical protein n=1 Tax=Glutamicibacter sp. PAEs-4 TaxID=3444114 RepID=UPI003EB8DF31
MPVEAHDLRATAAAYPPERHWSSYSSPLSPLLNTSMVRVLRRPIEFALAAAVTVDLDSTWVATVRNCHFHDIDGQMGLHPRIH